MNPVNSSEKSMSAVTHRFAVSDAEQETLEFLTTELSGSFLDLICAAVISERFCQTLLFEPDVALAHGFNGQRFVLTRQELYLVRSIRARSLAEFVDELRARIIPD